MRLGFAVAIHVDPEVLLIDEVLAVGDQGFTLKCLDKFSEFRRRNKTILLVTHSLDLVEKFCDQALWLDKGQTKAEGEPKRVVAAYLIDVERAEELELSKAESARPRGHRAPRRRQPRPHSCRTTRSRAAKPRPTCSRPRKAGGARARWRSPASRLIGADGDRPRLPVGRARGVQMAVRAHHPLKDFVFGFGIFNADGVCCYGTNTNLEELQPDEIAGEGVVTVRDRQPEAGRGHLSAGSCRAQARRLSLRLSPPAVLVPRQVAHARTLASIVPTTAGRSRRTSASSRPSGDETAEANRRDVLILSATEAVGSSTQLRATGRRSSSPTACSTSCTPAMSGI